MKTINHLLIIALFVVFFTALTNAGDFDKRILFNMDLNNVESITHYNGLIYMDSKDSLYIVSTEGRIIEKRKKTNQYLIIEGKQSFSIKNKTIVDSEGKQFGSFSKHLKNEKRNASFLAKSGTSFYICIRDTAKMSYSDAIMEVLKSGELSIFSYLVGIPTGLYCDGTKVWYLYSSLATNSNAVLRVYDIESRLLLSEDEIPVVNASGIYIDENFIYTYSNSTGEFVKLIRKEE